MLVTIDVTQEDIKRGIRQSCKECPGAKAINRKLADGYYCEVYGGGDGISILQPNDYRLGRFILSVDTPSRLQSFLDLYDPGICQRPVPFSFDVDLPEDLLRSNA